MLCDSGSIGKKNKAMKIKDKIKHINNFIKTSTDKTPINIIDEKKQNLILLEKELNNLERIIPTT